MDSRVAKDMQEMAAWRPIVAAACASLVGIGLARFAYTPLIPALIDAHWFTPSQAAYLGAANLAGYLVGALAARSVAGAARLMLRAMMLTAALTFIACSVPVSFPWFFVWRFVAGVAGGIVMVLAAPTVLPHVAPERRGLAAGAIFTGVALGIAASGLLVPPLVRIGLFDTWIALGVLALLLTLIAWGGWPRTGIPASVAAAAPPMQHRSGVLGALYVEYGLSAVGLVPHMIFLVDFVARGVGHGVASASHYWVLFGVGALAGPLLLGPLADRIGFVRALRACFLLQIAAMLIVLVSTSTAALVISSLIGGAIVPGVTVLTIGRIADLLHVAERQRAWSTATIAFAVGQAAAAYGFSFLYAQTGDYSLMFALGAGAFVVALGLDLAVNARRAPEALRDPMA